ncbi:unnamed protein product, partial [Durusdinium trenchii]
MPKTLMLASHFHGNEALMNQAINNGELMSKIDPVSKLEYLQFRKSSHTELRGNESGEQVQGDKKLNKEQAHALADSMSKLKWTFTLSKADEKRMDEQGQIPESVKKLAVKAKDACERLVKDGSKLVGVPELSGVKDAYKTLSQHITNLNQLLILGELPSQAAINRNSLENFIGGHRQRCGKVPRGNPSCKSSGKDWQ